MRLWGKNKKTWAEIVDSIPATPQPESELKPQNSAPILRPMGSAATTLSEAFGFGGSKFPGALSIGRFDPEHLSIYQLRYHSSKVYNSNTLARTAVDTKKVAIINRGLTLECKPIAKTVDKDWAKNTEQDFDLWAKHKGQDHKFQQNFYQQQNEAFRHFLLKGKVVGIARFIAAPKRGRLGRLNIELTHVNQLVTPLLEAIKKQKIDEDVIDGMHLDKTGAIVGAYFRKNKNKNKSQNQGGFYFYENGNQGNSLMDDWVYIPRWAERTGRLNLIIAIRSQYPGDVTGMPDLTPILHDLDKLEQYQVSEIQAALVNSFIALIQNSDGKNPQKNVFGSGGIAQRTDSVTDADGNDVSKTTLKMLGPGALVVAPEVGQSLASYDTKRPNVNFESFMKAVVASLSASLGIPQEILYKKFANNYSASRAALLEFWRYVIVERMDFGEDWCQPIWELRLAEQVGSGRIAAEGWDAADLQQRIINRRGWANSAWQGCAKGSVDPLKENKAAALAEDRGWTDAASNSKELYSKDFDTTIERRKKEVVLQREARLNNGDGTEDTDGGELDED